METMNYRERKKKGYKFSIFCFFLFILIGSALIYYGIYTEKSPTIIGRNYSDLEEKKRLEQMDALVSIYEDEKLEEIKKTDVNTLYNISENRYSDNSNKNIKADLSIPVITIDNVLLDELNKDIEEEYKNSFNKTKENMKNVENKFTYKVLYESYSNIVGLNKVLSIVITEKTVDDKNNKISSIKQKTYNINLDTKKVMKNDDIIADILGEDYNDIIKTNIKLTFIAKGYFNDNNYKYTYTGLQPIYVKNGNLQMIFNPGNINTDIEELVELTIKENE